MEPTAAAKAARGKILARCQVQPRGTAADVIRLESQEAQRKVAGCTVVIGGPVGARFQPRVSRSPCMPQATPDAPPAAWPAGPSPACHCTPKDSRGRRACHLHARCNSTTHRGPLHATCMPLHPKASRGPPACHLHAKRSQPRTMGVI